MASSSQQYSQQNNPGSAVYGQQPYQQQIRYSTPPVLNSQAQPPISSSQPAASSPMSIQSPMVNN
jgi:hypothetical protein